MTKQLNDTCEIVYILGNFRYSLFVKPGYVSVSPPGTSFDEKLKKEKDILNHDPDFLNKKLRWVERFCS